MSGSEYEVCLDAADPSLTVADLVRALGGDAGSRVAVDGRLIVDEVPLSELGVADGSLIELSASTDPRRFGVLRNVSDADTTGHALNPGATTIGMEPADLPVAGAAGRVVLHTDMAGRFTLRNPEGLGAVIGDSLIPPEGLPVADGASFTIFGRTFRVDSESGQVSLGSLEFNRPPRQIVAHTSAGLEPPAPPKEIAKPMRFGWGALVVPLLLGLGMAVLIHPRMAAFALFSPAMLLANWTEDRRRVRRERRESGRVFTAELDRFDRTVGQAQQEETDQRWAATTPPEELAGRALTVDPRIWERRISHLDFLSLPIGTGCVPWTPPLVDRPCPEAAEVMARFSELHSVPIVVQPQPGDVVGVAGDRRLSLGVVRQLVLQAAIHHGPADLSIWIFTETAADWDWAKWLPHVVVDSAGRRRVAATAGEVESVAALLPEHEADAHSRHLVVVDLPDLAAGPRARIREALRDGSKRGIAAVALARRSIDLPSLSTTVVSATGQGAHIRFPDGSSVALAPWTAGTALARRVARGVARVRDPEATISGSDLPDVVHLTSLRGMSDDLSRTIIENWQQSRDRPVAVLGSAGDGPFSVDLVADGPHALLAGTTGAGKSELLRTLVASLAVSSSPESLNFVLVDYKGGSAFDACSDLPHTVGLVTDLDDHLAKRALSCLEAELRYREQRLRDAAVSDIDAYFALGAAPLPRLLVVVDEFAALAMELPEFMDALVGIAQRGRSLGVHLLLATQRPNGVISDNIKANTNLRIALRVQDSADSVDVIGVGDAADVPGSLPGRGLARLGPRDVVPFQTALVTGSSMEERAAAVSVSPFMFAHEQPAPRNREGVEPETPTDLELMVAACVEAAGRTGIDQPRLPWPDPLPSVLARQDLSAPRSHLGSAIFGLADEPHRQRTMPVGWAPTSGNLLLYGLPGSGTTTALATVATALGESSSPDSVHIHVMDFDDQRLHPLRALPHVGSVIAGRDRERQLRLVRRLSAELEARRSATAAGSVDAGSYPTIVTMVDNYAGFADSYGEPGDMAVHNLLARLVADGPGVGMMTILTAKSPGDIPTRVASLVAQRLVFKLADRYDYTALGVPPVDPPETAGRAFEAGSGREVQVALPHPDGLGAAIGDHSAGLPSVAPWTIDVLPNEVSIADFVSAARINDEEWFLPLGIGDSFLDPAGLVLRAGEHALVTGPARSGKTTALSTLATVARAAHPGLRIAALVPRESKLRECAAIDEVVSADELSDALRLQQESLLLVDDVELIDGGDLLRGLIKERHPQLRVIGAGSADAIRGLYGHWTQDLRRSRIGCALRPNTVSDGDLWQTQLPRNGQMRFPVGRGYLLADGQTELIQLGCG